MGAERMKRKIIEAFTPHLESGEEVRAVFLGQTRIPPRRSGSPACGRTTS
jgi:hypothetical protein